MLWSNELDIPEEPLLSYDPELLPNVNEKQDLLVLCHRLAIAGDQFHLFSELILPGVKLEAGFNLKANKPQNPRDVTQLTNQIETAKQFVPFLNQAIAAYLNGRSAES